jgi:hypothetical protein
VVAVLVEMAEVLTQPPLQVAVVAAQECAL